MIKGKKLTEVLNFKSSHSLYREDGKWYHHLKVFPSILFDKDGHVVFKTKDDYLKNLLLQHAKDLHLIGGIIGLAEYTFFTEEEMRKIKLINHF